MSAHSAPPEDPVAFGPFRFDRGERVLSRDGTAIELPDRSIRLLEGLLQCPGETVSRDRLVDDIWQGAFVSDGSLSEAVSRLRQELDDDARQPTYIETVHRRGYRFVAPVCRPRSSTARRRLPWRLPLAASLTLILFAWGATSLRDGDPAGARAGVGVAAAPALDMSTDSDTRTPEAAVPEPKERPRYRLATVSLGGPEHETFRIPSLPLNDLSIDPLSGRMAFSMTEGGRSDVWVAEPRTGRLDRIATGGSFSDPVWQPGGSRLAMAQRRGDSFDLVLRAVEPGGPSQLLLDAPFDQYPESWSRDGATLVYSEHHPETGFDLWRLRRLADGSWLPTPIVRTHRHEAFGALSPDGRRVAFVSDIDGDPEVYVVDLATGGAPARVSTSRGSYPFWSIDGDRLHYLVDDEVRSVAAADLGTGSPLVPRVATSVAGLWLAGHAGPDELLVAMRDEPRRHRKAAIGTLKN